MPLQACCFNGIIQISLDILDTPLLQCFRVRRLGDYLVTVVENNLSNVSQGSTRSNNTLGEATINMAQHASSRASAAVSLPLKRCSYGSVLQVRLFFRPVDDDLWEHIN